MTIISLIQRVIVTLGIFVLLAPAHAAWARVEMRGKIYIYGKGGELTPIRNRRVFIEEIDEYTVSTDTGSFQLSLPDVFRPGDKVTLMVALKGYQILRPFGREAQIPADPKRDSVEVYLDKLGSHRFMNHQAFVVLIKDIANRAKVVI